MNFKINSGVGLGDNRECGRIAVSHVKRAIAASLLTVFLILQTISLCSCASEGDSRPKIVTTTFVLCDWVKNVLGDEAENYSVEILGANGADIHSYQPTVKDISLLSRCDAFVHIGGESDSWAEGALRSANNADMTVIDLSQALGSKLCAEEHGHDHGDEEHEHSFDEHIWFSFELARASVEKIAESLGERFTDKRDVFFANARSYCEEITVLEGEYSALKTEDQADGGCVVVADRYPFAYLFDSIGIEAHAAFEGCSAESEASFEVIARLSAVIDERGLSRVLVCEDSDGRIADAVIRNTKSKDAQILTLNSLQSLGSDDAAAGKSYISVMRENLEVLKKAL